MYYYRVSTTGSVIVGGASASSLNSSTYVWENVKTRKLSTAKKKHTLTAFLYLGIFTMLILSLQYFEGKGKEVALADLKTIESSAVQASDLVTVKIDDKLMQLLPLVCGARNCAGIDPKTKVIYYFPQNGHSYHFVGTSTNQIAAD